MPYSLRQIAPKSKFCHDLHLDVFDQIIPPATIAEVLSDTNAWEQREKALNMVVMVAIIMAMGLLPTQSIPHVLQTMAKGLRYVWPDPEVVLPTASALAQRRKQLGVKPIRELFERVCQPRATPEMPFAFRFGLRTMAIDGTCERTTDTKAPDLTFGRPHSQHGAGSFPRCAESIWKNAAPTSLWEQPLVPTMLARKPWPISCSIDSVQECCSNSHHGLFSARLVYLLHILKVHVIVRLASNVVPTYIRDTPHRLKPSGF